MLMNTAPEKRGNGNVGKVAEQSGVEQALNILILEDSVADAESCARELERAGLFFNMRRVDTRAAFEQALKEFGPDLVISDFTLSGVFDGLIALDLTRSKLADVPFVFVSGTVGEDRAVEAVKRGATDFVIKDRVQRLGPVIKRAVEEVRERTARRRAEEELERTRSQLNSILSSLSDVVWSFSLRENRLLYVNTSVEKTLGRAAVDFYIHSERWLDVIHPQDRERVEREWREMHAAGRFDSTYRIVLPGGKARWIHDRGGVVRDAHGKPERIDGIARDITQLKLQEQRIERLNRVYAVLSGINTAIVRIHDRQELFQEACRIAVEHGKFTMSWIGMLDEAAQAIRPVARAGREDGYLEQINLRIDSDVTGNVIMSLEAMARRGPVVCNDIATDVRMRPWRANALKRGYGSAAIFPLLLDQRAIGVFVLYAPEPGFFDEEEMKLLVEMAGDVSFAVDHIAKEEKLTYLAYYDALTGLPNRALFNDRLDQRVAAARRDRKVFFVIMLDIERFRHINETHGRQAGDNLLRQIAERLKGTLEETDVVAHIGGDYFSVATHRAEEGEGFAHLLERMLAGVSGQPFQVGGGELRIALRAGVALYPADGADTDGLLKNAEAALKEAKRTGQRYQFYARQMNARVAELLKLENELRRAILEDQFVLYYQPRFTLASSHIAGLEALIRWVHAERGLVSPGEFIPLLESTGMILEVGHWALKRAARDHAAWRAAGLNPPRIAVNVSAIQLRRKEFVESVRTAVSEAGDSREYIDVEITESMLMEDIVGSIEKLKAVQAMGVQVAMDDFGTGYSSLSYLTRLPINSLKIDRSFISQMARGPEQMAIVSTVISLARALNHKVVAEGVETEEQADMLRVLGCDEVQGYYFGKPMPVEDIETLLKKTAQRVSL
jgi:diguanylate cyclase (GGDEF)-like protein/PAS domain S-box-containing protein